MQLANVIDHTILKPDCTKTEIEALCQEAQQYGFKAVCVPPYFIKDAVKFLKGNPTLVSTVVGFPLGYSATAAKVEEIKRAIMEGADEIDAVVNISAVKCGDWNHIRSDIDSMTRAAHLKGKTIKVILETGLMDSKELQQLCKICSEEGADYVKTSTGFNAAGANPEIVRTLRKLLPKSVKIKASGGIRSQKEALELIEAGADRLGCSASVQIVQ